MSHPSDEIAVCCRKRPFPFRKNAHVPSQAGSACWSAYYGARFYENLDQPLSQGLQVYLLGSGYYYCSRALCDFSALNYISCLSDVLKPSIRAASYHNLVKQDFPEIPKALYVRGQMRKSHYRFNHAQIDLYCSCIDCISVRLEYLGRPLATAILVFHGGLVHLEYSVLGPGLYGHVGYCGAVSHGKAFHSLTSEFHRLVEGSVDSYVSNYGEYYVLS